MLKPPEREPPNYHHLDMGDIGGVVNPEPEPDLNLYPFQPKVKKNLTFQKISIYFQNNTEIMTPITLTRKIKQCKLVLL
jgi:hypothetical protein